MKEIRLSNLTLNQFQGGNFSLQPKGQDIFCYGENASGKTRLLSGFSWLLFGKDALGRAEFSIKNLDAEGNIAERGIDHSVEATLLVDSEEINLKKIFKEKWVKARGRAQAEFSGHSTQHFINSIPKTEKEYKTFIEEMTGTEEIFRLLTSPTTFPALPWQRQRSILLDVCGNISDANVIASDEKLFPLKASLEKFKSSKTPFDDLRSIISSRRTQINKELPQIAVRVDEVRRGIPITDGIDRQASEKEAQALETALNDAKLRLQGVNTGGSIADLTKKLSGLNADLRKMEDANRSGSLAILGRLNQEISEVEARVNASRKRIKTIDEDLKWKDSSLKSTDLNLSDLRNKWSIIDARKFEDTTSDTCPSCGQALPPDQVQSARDKALAAFNEDKAEGLGEINRRGLQLKEQRNSLAGEIDALKKEREIVSSSIHETETKLEVSIEERNVLKQSSEDFSGVRNRAELLDEIEDMESQILGEREGKAQDIEKIKVEISQFQGNLSSKKAIVDLFRAREQGERRIEELKDSEKKLSAEFEKLEGELYLMDLFVRQKVSMLTTRINDKFDTVRFKLFDVQINLAVSECCQITVGGVPFDAGLNNGARINAGLEIVKVLQEHYQLKAPVFADNAEAVNNLFDVGSQMIRLYVSEDKTLRVEVNQDGSQRTLHTPIIKNIARQGNLSL
jgi:hypothetical protein